MLLICSFSLLLLYLASGIYHTFYAPERSDRYLWGVYHVHSDLSDGMESPEGIARQARESGVRLVLLTDHEGDDADLRRLIDGVHIIGGSESSTPEGHLTYLGADRVPLFKLPPYPPDALADIREWGALPVVAYPADQEHEWQYWEADFNPGGIEIMNFSTLFRGMNLFQKTLVALHAPFSGYYILKYISPPSAALGKWERLLKNRQTYGLFALNAHGGFRIGDETAIRIPSYSNLFALMALGIDKQYTEPYAAVRAGDYFSCIRGAGEPQRFEFQAVFQQQLFPSGSNVPAGAAIQGRVETRKLTTRLDLIKDGKILESTSDHFEIDRADPGSYRAEVYLENHPLLSPDVPWIVSNPIIVGREGDNAIGGGDVPPRLSPLDLAEIHVEKDEQSSARFRVQDGGGTFDYELSLYLEGGKNRWCALACRKHRDLSEFDGFYLRAESDKYLRYFVELRSGDRWYYASFKVYPGKVNVCAVPFDKFYRVNANREAMPLSEIDSFFITTSNYTSRTDFSSTLKIHEMGFYSGVGP